MKKGAVRLVAALLITVTLLSGCWSRKELQELVFVTTMGIDWNAETQLHDLTVEIVRAMFIATPGQRPGGGPDQRPYAFITVSGRTVAEALLKLQRTRARRLVFTHLQVVIFGEQAAKHGIQDAINYLWRFHETRPYIEMIVARGPAEELLAGIPEQADVTGRWVTTLLEHSQDHGYVHSMPMHRLMYDAVTPGKSAIMPAFSLRPSGTPDPKKTPSVLMYEGDRVAIFHENRMVDILTPEESRGAITARGDLNTTVVTTTVPSRGDEFLSMTLRRVKAKIEVDKFSRGPLPKVALKVTAEGEFDQRQREPEPIPLEQVSDLEDAAARVVEAEIKAAITASKEAGADIIGFGEALRRANPTLWNRVVGDWSSRYRDLPVTVTVKVSIKRTGLLR